LIDLKGLFNIWTPVPDESVKNDNSFFSKIMVYNLLN